MSSRPTPSPPVRRPDQRGSSAVEMALLLPILAMLFFGVIEIANILRIQVTLHSAATTIARDAAMHQTTQASAEQFMAANDLVPGMQQSDDAQPPELTLTPAETATCKETPCPPFEVKLTYAYKAMIDPMKPFFDNLKLTASARKASEPW